MYIFGYINKTIYTSGTLNHIDIYKNEKITRDFAMIMFCQ